MSTPKECDWVSAKRLGRYLIGIHSFSIAYFEYQDHQAEVVVLSDTDFAGCRNERKSTSGGVIMLGSHCLKSWSLTQKVIALSSREAEYYGLVKSGSQGIGIRALLGDLGVACTVVLNTDASAAIGVASRRGLGKVRHIEVSQLWLQQRGASGDLKVQEVDGVVRGLSLRVKGGAVLDPRCSFGALGRRASEDEANVKILFQCAQIRREVSVHVILVGEVCVHAVDEVPGDFASRVVHYDG